MSHNPHSSISASQIRAARGLLNWSQEELADASGLSIATIRKLELGHISARLEMAQFIKRAFEGADLEFIEPNGVRQRPEEITIYDGPFGICSFYDDVYAHVSKRGDEVVTVCINEDPITDALGNHALVHRARMCALHNGTTVKCILTENNKSIPAEYCEYRSISKAYVDSVPFYIYDAVRKFSGLTNG